MLCDLLPNFRLKSSSRGPQVLNCTHDDRQFPRWLVLVISICPLGSSIDYRARHTADDGRRARLSIVRRLDGGGGGEGAVGARRRLG